MRVGVEKGDKDRLKCMRECRSVGVGWVCVVDEACGPVSLSSSSVLSRGEAGRAGRLGAGVSGWWSRM